VRNRLPNMLRTATTSGVSSKFRDKATTTLPIAPVRLHIALTPRATRSYQYRSPGALFPFPLEGSGSYEEGPEKQEMQIFVRTTTPGSQDTLVTYSGLPLNPIGLSRCHRGSTIKKRAGRKRLLGLFLLLGLLLLLVGLLPSDFCSRGAQK
jgi:hypothetical protein